MMGYPHIKINFDFMGFMKIKQRWINILMKINVFHELKRKQDFHILNCFFTIS